jgi:uncharacterized protein YegP (UPF0339 family)
LKFTRLAALVVAMFVVASQCPLASAQKPEPKKDAAKVADEVKSKDKAKATHFEIYKDSSGEFRFRLRGTDGSILAMSSKGYEKKEMCKKMIADIQAQAAKAMIEETDK